MRDRQREGWRPKNTQTKRQGKRDIKLKARAILPTANTSTANTTTDTNPTQKQHQTSTYLLGDWVVGEAASAFVAFLMYLGPSCVMEASSAPTSTSCATCCGDGSSRLMLNAEVKEHMWKRFSRTLTINPKRIMFGVYCCCCCFFLMKISIVLRNIHS